MSDEEARDPSGAPPELAAKVVLFHQLTLSADKASFLRSLGYEPVSAGTATKVLRLAREMSAAYVVLSLGSGSNAPERIAAAVLELPEQERPTLLCSVPQDAPRHRRRAAALGLEQIFVWPEGIVGRLVDGAPYVPTLSVRSAERLVLRQSFWKGDPEAQGGRLLNISATGALLLFKVPHDDDYLSIGFKLPNEPVHMWLTGKVVRCDERPSGTLVALRFVRISPRQQRRIRDFVRSCNVISVKDDGSDQAVRLKVRAQPRGRRRADYFVLEELTITGGLLVPRVSFVPPYDEGTALDLTFVKLGLQPIASTVQERVERSYGRIDTLICWRVRFESLEQGATLVSSVESLNARPDSLPGSGGKVPARS